MLHLKPEYLQVGRAGPAIVSVLHAPSTASSGLNKTCFTCGFIYGFLPFGPFDGFISISNYLSTGIQSSFPEMRSQVFHLPVSVSAHAILAFTVRGYGNVESV